MRDTDNKISGKSGATKLGSSLMKVSKTVMQRPISSSLYSSIGIPHLVHLSQTDSSPTRSELCRIIKGLSRTEYSEAEESIRDCWAVVRIWRQASGGPCLYQG